MTLTKTYQGRDTMKKTDEIRERYAAADARVKELAQELRDLPGELERAARREGMEKAGAARHGGGHVFAVASDLPQLKVRQEALPYEVWAARMARVEASIELHQAELGEATEEARAAGAERERTEKALREAEEAHRAAADRSMMASSRAQDLRIKIRRARQDLTSLQVEGPRHTA